MIKILARLVRYTEPEGSTMTNDFIMTGTLSLIRDDRQDRRYTLVMALP